MGSSVYDKYQMVIGLEIHIQLSTASKAYCADLNEYGSVPNTNVSAISLGHPGTLPLLNEKVVDYAVRLGLAVNANIAPEQHFARKNYFYADLPKGYQITQDTTPICTGGYIDIKTEDDADKRINVTRIHMEEDAGKSMHDLDIHHTLVDLNRAGVPLLEIVSEPEIRSAAEAYYYITEVRRLVRYLEICDGNMEEGSMRCDANISVMLKGTEKFGERCEVKNMNSIRNVARAIDSEAKRQIDLIEKGETIAMQTRSYDAVSNTTSLMRSKEEAHDYRYFPEPDLQPLLVTEEYIENVRKKLPPLPRELFAKYTTELGLSPYDAGVLTDSKPIALYFEELIRHTSSYKTAANWVMGAVKSYLNQQAVTIEEFPVSPERLAGLIALIEEGKVNNNMAEKKIFPILITSGNRSALEIARENALLQEDKSDEIATAMKKIMAENPDKVEKYRSGQTGLLGMFMGQVMRHTGGKADPKKANELVRKMLEKN